MGAPRGGTGPPAETWAAVGGPRGPGRAPAPTPVLPSPPRLPRLRSGSPPGSFLASLRGDEAGRS